MTTFFTLTLYLLISVLLINVFLIRKIKQKYKIEVKKKLGRPFGTTKPKPPQVKKPKGRPLGSKNKPKIKKENVEQILMDYRARKAQKSVDHFYGSRIVR